MGQLARRPRDVARRLERDREVVARARMARLPRQRRPQLADGRRPIARCKGDARELAMRGDQARLERDRAMELVHRPHHVATPGQKPRPLVAGGRVARIQLHRGQQGVLRRPRFRGSARRRGAGAERAPQIGARRPDHPERRSAAGRLE